jgi:hypothetical protein
MINFVVIRVKCGSRTYRVSLVFCRLSACRLKVIVTGLPFMHDTHRCKTCWHNLTRRLTESESAMRFPQRLEPIVEC